MLDSIIPALYYEALMVSFVAIGLLFTRTVLIWNEPNLTVPFFMLLLYYIFPQSFPKLFIIMYLNC